VKHGSTREVYDGSTVCVPADVHTAVTRHDTSGSWYDVMDPLEQPRQGELQETTDLVGSTSPAATIHQMMMMMMMQL